MCSTSRGMNTRPVVALDERPAQLWVRCAPIPRWRPASPRDYEYALCGTANVFCVIEPRAGRHQTHATENRITAQFAGELNRIALS